MSAPPPPRRPPTETAAYRGDPGLDPLELGNPAGKRDTPRMVVAVDPLRLPQKVPEQRVVEVYHGHHYPARVAARLSHHVHRQVPLRHVRRRWHLLSLVVPDPDVPAAAGLEVAEPLLGQTEDLANGVARGSRGRAQAVVCRVGVVESGKRHPSEELRELGSEPEPSASPPPPAPQAGSEIKVIHSETSVLVLPTVGGGEICWSPVGDEANDGFGCGVTGGEFESLWWSKALTREREREMVGTRKGGVD